MNLSIEKIKSKQAVIGIIGLGYVGLPLARAFSFKGFKVIGFDIDETQLDLLNNNESYIKHISNDTIKSMRMDKGFICTSDFNYLREVNVIIICVPTPLSKHREPDLSPILNTGETISKHVKKGQLIILESSTYPGTTDDELGSVIEKSGLIKNKDFYLAYSPERED
ncbi:MAG: NAD(P)-binding domain-containing protein, partial [Gammaproteobacteria bacterium]